MAECASLMPMEPFYSTDIDLYIGQIDEKNCELFLLIIRGLSPEMTSVSQKTALPMYKVNKSMNSKAWLTGSVLYCILCGREFRTFPESESVARSVRPLILRHIAGFYTEK